MYRWYRTPDDPPTWVMHLGDGDYLAVVRLSQYEWSVAGKVRSSRISESKGTLAEAFRFAMRLAWTFGFELPTYQKNAVRKEAHTSDDSLLADVAAALVGQGYKRKLANEAAQAASGSDFETLFRSALEILKGNATAEDADPTELHEQVASALKNLGYGRTAIDAAMATATGDNFDSLLRSALRPSSERAA